MKSRVSTSVSAQSLLSRCRARISTNFLSGLFGAVNGASLTGTGAQAVRGAPCVICNDAARPAPASAAVSAIARIFLISRLSFWTCASLGQLHLISCRFPFYLEIQAVQRAMGDAHLIACRRLLPMRQIGVAGKLLPMLTIGKKDGEYAVAVELIGTHLHPARRGCRGLGGRSLPGRLDRGDHRPAARYRSDCLWRRRQTKLRADGRRGGVIAVQPLSLVGNAIALQCIGRRLIAGIEITRWRTGRGALRQPYLSRRR